MVQVTASAAVRGGVAAAAVRRLSVVTADPAGAVETLALAVFEAASRRLGIEAIEDVVPGPCGSALLVTSSDRDGLATPAESRTMRTEIARNLFRHGAAETTVELATLKLAPASTLADIADLCVSQARATSSLSATRRAYGQAIAGLLARHAIRTLFQPILDIHDGSVVGYEALSRGPREHPLEAAGDLLDAAAISGRTTEVDREMAWLATTRAAARLGTRDALLFINATGDLPWWRPVTTHRMYPMWPTDHVVIEFSERSPISQGDDIVQHRERARGRGLRFALDDTGSGFAGLSTLVLVAPEFVKVDISLVRGCDRDRLKQEVISALLTLGRTGHFEVIAEGVETAAELTSLRRLGVRLGQGYVLGRPVEHPKARGGRGAWSEAAAAGSSA